MLRLYVHCVSCLVLVYRLLTTLAKKKRESVSLSLSLSLSLSYRLERQMEANTRPVARVVVCLSQESSAKFSYLLDLRVSVLVVRKNLGA